MSEPKITVLMPVYNAERFLRKAVESILQQTFRNFEFIIIDDGSTDNSVEIISSYEDARIRFYRNERNVGITETLNNGIGLAQCDLIARMDADDVSYPDRLQKQFNYMQLHPDCALLSTWARVISEDGKFARLERYRSEFYYYNLTFECWMYHPTIMFRKSCVEAVGMYSKTYSEDYDLFWKLSTRFKIGNLTEPLVDYRLSSTSLNTVLRKSEYEKANEENVLRNIRYYMGTDFELPKSCLECLRHNFGPLIEQGGSAIILEALEKLDQITDRILTRDNVNLDRKAIKRAHYFKRRFIIQETGRMLPLLRGVELFIKTNAWLVLYRLAVHSLNWRLRRAFRIFLQ